MTDAPERSSRGVRGIAHQAAYSRLGNNPPDRTPLITLRASIMPERPYGAADSSLEMSATRISLSDFSKPAWSTAEPTRAPSAAMGSKRCSPMS